jgi:hypothetical protein
MPCQDILSAVAALRPDPLSIQVIRTKVCGTFPVTLVSRVWAEQEALRCRRCVGCHAAYVDDAGQFMHCSIFFERNLTETEIVELGISSPLNIEPASDGLPTFPRPFVEPAPEPEAKPKRKRRKAD